MASTAVPARTRTTPPTWHRMRRALTGAAGRTGAAASAARARLRRPALVVGGLGLMDAAAWQGPLWAGLLATGISLWVYEALTGGDE